MPNPWFNRFAFDCLLPFGWRQYATFTLPLNILTPSSLPLEYELWKCILRLDFQCRVKFHNLFADSIGDSMSGITAMKYSFAFIEPVINWYRSGRLLNNKRGLLIATRVICGALSHRVCTALLCLRIDYVVYVVFLWSCLVVFVLC